MFQGLFIDEICYRCKPAVFFCFFIFLLNLKRNMEISVPDIVYEQIKIDLEKIGSCAKCL